MRFSFVKVAALNVSFTINTLSNSHFFRVEKQPAQTWSKRVLNYTIFFFTKREKEKSNAIFSKVIRIFSRGKFSWAHTDMLS